MSWLPRPGRPALTALVLAVVVPAVLLPGCGPGDAEPAGPRRPHVLIWMVDTLRADHLSSYGYERPTSPTMDALAADGALFEQFHTASNWTQPSVATMLSGFDPPAFDGGFAQGCPEELFLAAEAFQHAGYRTVGLTVTVATAARFGFAQGFDVYRELDAEQDGRQRTRRSGAPWDADLLVDETLALLDADADDARPLFLYLHSVDPHTPYETHPERPSFTGPYDGPMDGQVDTLHAARKQGYEFSEADRRHLTDLYDDEVAFNDAQLGRLVQGLAARELLDDTLLLVVGDHGEEFWERGDRGHSQRNLHGELTRVPLILHWPAGLAPGQRVPDLARGVDVLPTLLDLTRIDQLIPGDGRSLAPLLSGPGVPDDQGTRRPVRAYIDRCKGDQPYLALRTDEWLLVWDTASDERRLFAWREDPQETRDVAADHPQVVTGLHADLARWLAERQARGGSVQVDLDPETRARLQAMGYLR